ncbi:MAG: TIGR00730 family Rossman fold protein, partial [Candidatus Latescibacteria bacterium]|nr:TIGR00730 family Rossman fold protein [Candidatus Latescibacterota bacterium]
MPLSVCVFCASSDSIDGVYRDAAKDLAHELAAQGMTLVYGGGNNGLMGVLAGEMYESGGAVVGVIPQRFVELGFAFDRADEMIVTDGMRERKAIMEERADGFIGLPGGFGTLEEMLEI